MRLAISQRRFQSRAAAAGLFVSTLTLASVVSAGVANAVIFNKRFAFEATLVTSITDDYSSPGYRAGDVRNQRFVDFHSDANMSAVFGETRYISTSSPDNNIIGGQLDGDPYYCTGCNGSYLLDFTATSIGTARGVFGVGLDVLIQDERVLGTTAFVTYGDGTTENFAVPGGPPFTTTQFWGITDPRLISSIAFGLRNGEANSDGSVQRMAHDNLTIGTQAQVLPEPSAILLFGLGLVGLGLTLRRARPAAMRRGEQQAIGSPRLAISRRPTRSTTVTAGLFVSTLALASVVSAGMANAVIFDNRIAFEATLGMLITDDYSSLGYAAGDVTNAANFDIHTDANMSAIFGETRYTSTILPIPFTNRNFVRQTSGDAYYCGDCNASYLLDFTATSIGTPSGVFGVGFDVRIVAENIQAGETAAFVTYGDGTIESFAIPGQPDFTTDQFWALPTHA